MIKMREFRNFLYGIFFFIFFWFVLFIKTTTTTTIKNIIYAYNYNITG